jgi:hypothetical protein
LNFIFKDEKYLFLDSTSNKYNLVRYCFSLYFYSINHYQKIDKYKRKYRGNIFVDKFPRDFTDGNISSVYTDGITVGKKNLKQSKKKMTCHFYRRNFPSVIPLVNPSVIPLVNCEHCSSCQLQRESPMEFSVGIFQRVLFDGFLKKFN